MKYIAGDNNWSTIPSLQVDYSELISETCHFRKFFINFVPLLHLLRIALLVRCSTKLFVLLLQRTGLNKVQGREKATDPDRKRSNQKESKHLKWFQKQGSIVWQIFIAPREKKVIVNVTSDAM